MKMMHVTSLFREPSHVLHIPSSFMLLYQYYAVSFLYKILFWEERYTGLWRECWKYVEKCPSSTPSQHTHTHTQLG